MKLKFIILAIGIIGVGLFLYSLSIPSYKDEIKAKEVISFGQSIKSGESQKMVQYYEQINELKTNKLIIRNTGIGFLVFSCTLFLFLIFNKINKLSDFKNLKTFKKQTIFLSANLITLGISIGYFLMLYIKTPEEYDISSGIVDMYSFTYIFLIFLSIFILLVGLNLFIGVTSIKSVFPSDIFIIPSYRKVKEIVWELFWCICFLGLIIILIYSIIGGGYFIIVGVLFYIYIVSMLRAGKINKWKYEIEKFKQNNI